MRFLRIMLPLMLVAPTITSAQTNPVPPPAPSAGKYSAEETPLGTLLDDPAAKAVLAKHLPTLVSSDQVDMARTLTLKSLQTYAADEVTDAKLAAVNADLAKLPVKK